MIPLRNTGNERDPSAPKRSRRYFLSLHPVHIRFWRAGRKSRSLFRIHLILNPFMGARFGMIWFCVLMRIDYTHMCIYQFCRNIYSPSGIKNLNTLRVDILDCAIYTKRKGVSRE